MPLKATIVYEDGRYPFNAPVDCSPGDIVTRPDGSLAIVDGLTTFAVGDRIEADPIVPCKVIEAACNSGDTWAATATLYWDGTNKVLTTTSAGNTLVGKSIAAKTSGQTTARVVVS